MKTNIIRHGGLASLIGVAAFLSFPKPGAAELVVHPKHYGVSLDFGELQEGYMQGPVEDFTLTRTGVFLGVSATHNENLELRLTMGGLFWYAGTEQTDAVNRTVKYGAGAGEAQGIYSFGDPENPSATLQFGLFPVKYGDSHNLGEYLYRSGTYPGYMVTGGWSYLQSAAYTAQGARVSLPTFDGKVTHDFTVFMERDWEPHHDLSPGYQVTARPNSFLEFGAGVVWAHAVPLRSGRDLSPRLEANAYSKTTGMPVDGAVEYGVTDSVVFLDPGNPLGGFEIVSDTTAREAQTLRDWEACQTGGDCSNIGYYTFRGFKGILRASVDFGTMLGNPSLGPGVFGHSHIGPDEFKLYVEAALLGFKDYPYYYEDKLQRMPVMAGVNIPTFGLFDRFSAEVEYRKTNFRNTIYGVNTVTIPVPLPSYGEETDAYKYLDAENTDDDFKWSFFVSRRIVDGLKLHAQVASDHTRHPNFWGVMSAEPATEATKEWYYVVRADFSL